MPAAPPARELCSHTTLATLTRRRDRDASIFATQKHPPLPAAGDYTPRPLAFHGVQRPINLKLYYWNKFNNRTMNIYFIKVVLRGVSPMIWRRLRISGNTSLAILHDIIQCVYGWDGFHLHQFHIHGKDHGINYIGAICYPDNAVNNN